MSCYLLFLWTGLAQKYSSILKQTKFHKQREQLFNFSDCVFLYCKNLMTSERGTTFESAEIRNDADGGDCGVAVEV